MEMVPDSNRRTVMNLLLVGAIGLPVASLAGYVCEPTLLYLTLSDRSAAAHTYMCTVQALHLFLRAQRVSTSSPS